MYLFIKITIINTATLGIRALKYESEVGTNIQSVTDGNAKMTLNFVKNVTYEL